MRTTPVLATAALAVATALGGAALPAVAAPVHDVVAAVSAHPQSTGTPVRLHPGTTSTTVSGSLPAGGSRTYRLEVRKEQVIELDVERSSDLQTFTLVAPGGQPLHTDHTEQQGGGTFVAPSTGDYLLTVRSAAASRYSLHLTVPQQLRFAPGGTSTSVRGSLPASDDHPYSFAARAGQRATVTFSAAEPGAVWFLVGPDGTPLHTDHTSAQQGRTTVVLPTTGTYRLDVRSGAATGYELGLAIPR